MDGDGGMRKISSLSIGTKYLVERCFSLTSGTGCSRSDNVHSLRSSQKTVALAGLPACEYTFALAGEGGRDRPE